MVPLRAETVDPLPTFRPLTRRSGVALLLACLCTLAACAPGAASRSRYGGDRDWFDAEVLTGIDDEGQPVATITVSIAFRDLVFRREGSVFVSRYRMRAIQKIAGRSVSLQEWTGSAEADSYEDTRANRIVRRTVPLELVSETAKGVAASLDLLVEVEGTRRVGRVRLPLSVRPAESGTRSLGELALYRLRDRGAAPEVDVEVMGHAVPDPAIFRRQRSGEFDLATGEPWLLLRVFDLRRDVPPSENHLVTVRVLGKDDDVPRWTKQVNAPRQGTETSVLLLLPAQAFAYGTNRVRVQVEGTEAVTLGLENLGLDFEDAESWQANLRQIATLAEGDELAPLRQCAAPEREAMWNAFWERRDPDPASGVNEALEEHYRRVSYARANLRDGFRDGALSDRGRIWVRHGRPDSVETTTPGYDSNLSYEVWRYPRVGMVYYFQDSDGLGRYRLVWQDRT